MLIFDDIEVSVLLFALQTILTKTFVFVIKLSIPI